MPRAIPLVPIIAMGCVAIGACQPQQASPPNASVSGSTTSATHNGTAASYGTPANATAPQTTPTTTPTCVGLSICEQPPDAEGNPACYYSDGWRANDAGIGIEVWYFHEPQNLSKPEKITALVRKKDGTSDSQDADIAAGQQTHRFEFPAINASAVQEVFLNTGTGRCFVVGP
jgi:hypothetical protein